jgi:hypothetical protein
MRRKLIETLERRKEMMIASLWANSGFEGQEGANARRDAIEELEENYEEAVENILGGTSESEPDIDKSNPFFAAAERGLAKVVSPPKTDGTVAEAIADEDGPFSDMDIDQ